MDKKSLVYFQSGGPTTVINSSLFGVIEEAMKHPSKIDGIYGSRYGVEGLIKDDLVDLRAEDPDELKLLTKTSGAILGSTRLKLPTDNDPLFGDIINTITKHNIGYILINGGNDSMDTCYRLSRFFKDKGLDIKVIGINKTVDNDLMVTDHSLGYPSAAKHIINTVGMVTADAKSYTRSKVVLIEIMGRETGWLTAAVDLLPEDRRPDLIYIPEMKWDEDQFLKDVQSIYAKNNCVVAAVSEGMPVEHINDGVTDAFGHKALEGTCLALGKTINDRLHLGVRTVELSIIIRSDPLLASPVDVKEAVGAGRYAVKSVLSGHTGKMVCIKRVNQTPYRSSFFLGNVEDIADLTKYVPKSFIQDNHRFTEAFRDYLRPLLGNNFLYPNPRMKMKKVR